MILYQLEYCVSGRMFPKIFKTISRQSIKDYVLNNIDSFSDELNEPYSCCVNLSHDGTTIIISGDEDLVELTIKRVDLIEL